MKRISQRSAQDLADKTGFLDLLGESQELFEPVKLDSLASSLAWLAANYADKLTKRLNEADASSSGDLADSIVPLDVEILGTVYSVAIEAKKYADFIDEGVSGWANDRGSRFKFKTRGVDPKGPMVKSIKAYLLREGKISRNTKVAVSKREAKRGAITDATTRAAISTAYMIKRQGIAPTHFWRNATADMAQLVEKELGAALKVDIINNLSNN
jgi:hypothetical protein